MPLSARSMQQSTLSEVFYQTYTVKVHSICHALRITLFGSTNNNSPNQCTTYIEQDYAIIISLIIIIIKSTGKYNFQNILLSILVTVNRGSLTLKITAITFKLYYHLSHQARLYKIYKIYKYIKSSNTGCHQIPCMDQWQVKMVSGRKKQGTFLFLYKDFHFKGIK